MKQAIFELEMYKWELEYESLIAIDVYGLYFRDYKRCAP